MIRAIAFDFGGTLFSTKKMGLFTQSMTSAFVEATSLALSCSKEFAETLFQAYVAAWQSRRDRAATLPEVEVNSLELLQTALVKLGVQLSRTQKIEILNQFHTLESEHFVPIDGVIEALSALAMENYRLSIVSNNPWTESIRAALRRHQIEDLFEQVIVSCDIGFRKPHPPIFKELIARLALDPSQILFVGDSFPHDIRTPKALGFRTCLVSFEGAQNCSAPHNGSDIFLTNYSGLVTCLAQFK